MSLNTLDLLIGLVVVYLLLSLVLVALREAIEARLKSRARHLASGIQQMFQSIQDAQDFYNSPLIRALSRSQGLVSLPPAYFQGYTLPTAVIPFLKAFLRRPAASDLPSYIPARVFAQGLVELVMKKANINEAVTVKTVTKSLEVLAQKSGWASSLRVVIASAGEDLELALKQIEGWYEGVMDRVAGRYRRESHYILFWMGLILAVVLNVDSIFLAKHLAIDQKARHHLVDIAERMQTARSPDQAKPSKQDEAAMVRPPPVASSGTTTVSVKGEPSGETVEKTKNGNDARLETENAIATADKRVVQAMEDFSQLGLPIGWSETKWHWMWESPVRLLQAAVGWLLTGLALALGAPFWFDLLNKIMVIRSTVKPTPKGDGGTLKEHLQ